jgi:hypothetical protein
LVHKSSKLVRAKQKVRKAKKKGFEFSFQHLSSLKLKKMIFLQKKQKKKLQLKLLLVESSKNGFKNYHSRQNKLPNNTVNNFLVQL